MKTKEEIILVLLLELLLVLSLIEISTASYIVLNGTEVNATIYLTDVKQAINGTQTNATISTDQTFNYSFGASTTTTVPATTTTTTGNGPYHPPEEIHALDFTLTPTQISPSPQVSFLPGDTHQQDLYIGNYEDFTLILHIHVLPDDINDLCSVTLPRANQTVTDLSINAHEILELHIDCYSPLTAQEGEVYRGNLTVLGCKSDNSDICDQRSARIDLPIQSGKAEIPLIANAIYWVSNYNPIESFKHNPAPYILIFFTIITLVIFRGYIIGETKRITDRLKKRIEQSTPR